MPEMKMEVSPRAAARLARLKLIADNVTRPATIKVFAGNEDYRRVVRHPNGTRFRAELGEAVEWPNDSFTTRRIADGTVRLDGPGPAERPAEDEKLSLREQIRARAAVKIKDKAEAKAETRRAAATKPE